MRNWTADIDPDLFEAAVASPTSPEEPDPDDFEGRPAQFAAARRNWRLLTVARQEREALVSEQHLLLAEQPLQRLLDLAGEFDFADQLTSLVDQTIRESISAGLLP